MGCKDRTGTADKVKTAAFALGELHAGVALYEPGAGRDFAVAYANQVAAAQMAVMAPVLAEVERLAGEVALLQSAERDGSEAFAREDVAAEGVKVGDTFRWIGGRCAGEIGEVTRVLPEGSGQRAMLVTGADLQWFSESLLLDPCEFQRVRAVEAPPLASEPGAEGERLATDADYARPIDATGVGLGGFAPAPEGAAWGGMEPDDRGVADLDGPAGDELPFAEQREDRRAQAHAASVREADRKTIEAWKETTLDLATKHGEALVELVNAQTALADMRQRCADWEASCTTTTELREAGTDIAKLAAAWSALRRGTSSDDSVAEAAIDEVLSALSQRAVSW